MDRLQPCGQTGQRNCRSIESQKGLICATFFQKNYAALEQDLMALDRTLKQMVSKDRARPLVVSHPVYGYFARRYGLNIKSVHWEPDETPANEQMMELNRIFEKSTRRNG